MLPTRLTGHVELFKRDEETGKLLLVSTSRPCEVCGQALEGLVIPRSEATGDAQVHPSCRERTRIYAV